MPTENPKISAYVPQVVYDRFKEFQEERDLSMSQAAIEIFAHYFGINLEISIKEFTGGLPGKLSVIEQSLAELKELYTQLASKVENIKTTSEPLAYIAGEVNSQVAAISELPSELPKLSEDSALSDDDKPETGELLSTLQSEPPEKDVLEAPVQLNFIDSTDDSPSGLLKELSLSESKLAERLSMNRSTLSSQRKKGSDEKFAQATFTKDPNAIKWAYSQELKCYLPCGELSLEQTELLKAWKMQHSTK